MHDGNKAGTVNVRTRQNRGQQSMPRLRRILLVLVMKSEERQSKLVVIAFTRDGKDHTAISHRAYTCIKVITVNVRGRIAKTSCFRS